MAHRTRLVFAALAASTLAATGAGSSTATAAGPPTAAAYARAVTRICAGALLFDHRHEMGTRADALSVARDIRASTRRRLALVAEVTPPPKERGTAMRWIALEQRLANAYARDWVRIFDVIDAARTPRQRARLPRELERLVHASDRLRRVVIVLELKLHVPDCTGGVPTRSPAKRGDRAEELGPLVG